ncbi:hypothetical protein DT076_03250 [Desertihabitans brevis]|uniref:Uncharacterized protein n=1 Tax=Desertihabitans brevis TaxID=2268447 RepID=A0A367Z2H9_9ACTN|nr:hypothetical protein [Desertihabitans brevis]RCK71442.1 hypothetical protein DT076_03250 [Desertihabitans brevis]
MSWVWVFVVIGVVGLLSLVGWAVWLFHKAADVWSEIAMLGRRAEELGSLLEQLRPEPTPEQLQAVRDRTRVARRG